MSVAAPHRRRIAPQRVTASVHSTLGCADPLDPNDAVPRVDDLDAAAARARQLLGPGRKLLVDTTPVEGGEVIVNWQEVRVGGVAPLRGAALREGRSEPRSARTGGRSNRAAADGAPSGGG